MIRATHIDGPLDGAENQMHAPRVPKRLFYAHAPGNAPPGFLTNGYMLVGYDQEPEQRWPGQIEYQLDRDASSLEPGHLHPEQEQGTAVFRVVD